MFSDAISLFIKNPIVGLPNVVAALLSIIASRFMLDTSYFENLTPEKVSGLETIPPGLAWTISQFLLFMILAMMFQPMIQAVTSLLCINVVNDYREYLPDTIRHSFKYYWRILGILVFKFFVTLVFIFISIAAMFPLLKNIFQGEIFTTSNIVNVALLILLSFVLMVFLLLLNMILLPIDPMLVYEDLSLGDAIAKGFKFGLRKFFPLLGASIVMILSASCINFIFSLFIPNTSGVSTLTSSFLSAFIVLYIVCLYKAEIAARESSSTNTNTSTGTSADADADTNINTDIDTDTDTDIDNDKQ